MSAVPYTSGFLFRIAVFFTVILQNFHNLGQIITGKLASDCLVVFVSLRPRNHQSTKIVIYSQQSGPVSGGGARHVREVQGDDGDAGDALLPLGVMPDKGFSSHLNSGTVPHV